MVERRCLEDEGKGTLVGVGENVCLVFGEVLVWAPLVLAETAGVLPELRVSGIVEWEAF